MSGELPLGRPTTYPDTSDPTLLHPIPRAGSRALLGISGELPFGGEDVWNAWDLTWLTPRGQPRSATAVIRFPASSPNILESKSVKLYLNSLSMTPFDNEAAVADRLSRDLSTCAGADIATEIADPAPGLRTQDFTGCNLDLLLVDCSVYAPDPRLLSTVDGPAEEETLYTHAFRSLCPVTGQPDLASVAVSYRGARISPEGLLRYLVSFRRHQDFHEACVERMFVDIVERCAPGYLSVYARFQRRGGIDINPFRTSGNETAPNLRLWRQ